MKILLEYQKEKKDKEYVKKKQDYVKKLKSKKNQWKTKYVLMDY